MLRRALKPNGVLLMTVPGIVPLGDRPGHPDKPDCWPWYWMVTVAGLRRPLEEGFGDDAAAVEAHGNDLSLMIKYRFLNQSALRRTIAGHDRRDLYGSTRQ
jgi:hypothetical protein